MRGEFQIVNKEVGYNRSGDVRPLDPSESLAVRLAPMNQPRQEVVALIHCARHRLLLTEDEVMAVVVAAARYDCDLAYELTQTRRLFSRFTTYTEMKFFVTALGSGDTRLTTLTEPTVRELCDAAVSALERSFASGPARKM